MGQSHRKRMGYRVGRYISPDRFARKSLGVSAYTYVANAPMKWADPSGDSIFIYIDGEEINYFDRPYDWSKLSEGERELLHDLRFLWSTREGAKVLRELTTNKYHNVIHVNRYFINRAYTYYQENACDPGIGGPGEVEYNWIHDQLQVSKDSTMYRPPYLGLFHELIHVLHYNRGTLDPVDDQTPTIEHENELRKELRDEWELPWIELRPLP